MMNRIRTVPILMLALGTVAAAPRAALATPEGDAARTDIQKTFGFVPGFMKLVPDLALPGAWMEFKGLLLSPTTALPPKMKDLVGLAVPDPRPVVDIDRCPVAILDPRRETVTTDIQSA